MRGFADVLAMLVFLFLGLVGLTVSCDLRGAVEERMDGEILDVMADDDLFGYVGFSVTLDLDNGSVVVCPVQSDMLGGTLYKLYRNRNPELPRLRETARVQVGRHSGSVVCRGLAIAESGE